MLDQIALNIENYIETPATNFAIQIDGKWGTGKTHYMKSVAKEKIEELNYRFCYISLNGVSNIETIKKELFYELCPTKSSISGKSIGLLRTISTAVSPLHPAAETASGLLASMEEKFINITPEILEKTVICFDDLERINDKLSIQEFFGFVNTYLLEHNSIKVIILSNEIEISDFDSRVKEKVIARTLNFHIQDMSLIIDDLFKPYCHSAYFNDFFIKNKNEILNTIDVLNIRNIRTLKYVISSFYIALNHVNDILQPLEVEHRRAVIRAMFLNLLIASNENKEGFLKKGDRLSYANNWRTPIFIKYADNAPEEEKSTSFINRYHNISNYIDENVYYFDCITCYVLEGTIDIPLSKENINDYINSRFPSKKTELTIFDTFHELENYLQYEDEEFQKILNKFFEELEREVILPQQYLEFFRLLHELENIKLISPSSNWKETIYKMFNMSVIQIQTPFRLEKHKIGKKTGINEYDNMIDTLENMQNSNTRSSKIINVKNWCEFLLNGNIDRELERLIEVEKDFFELTNELDFLNNYLAISNRAMVEYQIHIKNCYLRISNKNDYNKHEIPHIEKMLNNTRKLISNNSSRGKISRINMEKLVKMLEDLILHLKK